MKKIVLTCICALAGLTALQAQLKVGDNPTTINASSVLEAESTNKGLLIPRIALTGTASASPLAAHVAGMMVYNTATAGDVTPGFYYNNGTAWQRVVAGSAATTLYTGDGSLGGNRTVTMGSNNLYFTGSGNVGIGTASPAGTLSVFSSSGTQQFNVNPSSTLGLQMLKSNLGANSVYSLQFGKAASTRNLAGLSWNHVADGSSSNYVSIDIFGVGSILNVASSGNVGIGTTSPSSKLHVSGDITCDATVTLSTANSNQATVWLGDVAALRPANTKDFQLWNSVTGTQFTVLQNGNVGIGTTTPSTDIQISSATSAINFGNSDAVTGAWIRNDGTNTVFSTKKGSIYYGFNGTANQMAHRFYAGTASLSEVMTINTNGRIGIGTTSPTVPLDIATSTTINNTNYAYLNASGAVGVIAGTFAAAVSLKTSGRIVVAGGEIDVLSDARTKNVAGRSDNTKDLETLKKIEIVDYTMRDVVAQGNTAYKKVVADQVLKVYPQVVSVMPAAQAVPTIYRTADAITQNQDKLTISLAAEHNLTIGQKVKLVTQENGTVTVDVVAVNSKNSFTVAGIEKPETKVFVYGPEVNDVKMVDYEGIAMLNVSATQALAQQVEAQKAEIEELKAELKAVMKKKKK